MSASQKKIFDHRAIEKKWQDYWERENINRTPDAVAGKKNYYTLVEFPYPSGNLHVGHWYAFAVTDIFARFQRMLGKNVLYPIGFDAFGLPAENAAIKHGINPRDWTEQNIAHMSKQLKSMGAMFDWSRMVKTIDPDYYRWTQWMFIQFMKAGLAEQKEVPANWCPSCKTVLANEQVINGKCERCGAEVLKKDLKQWTLKITKYADRLIDDLDELDWPEEIKKSQKEWIGRSYGALIEFPIVIKGWGAGSSLNNESSQIESAPHNFSQKNAEQTRNGAEGGLLYGDITYKIRAAIFEVKKELGLGHKESVYHNALKKAFGKQGLHFESEKQIPVYYDGEKVGTYVPDFVVEDKILIELKALPKLGKQQLNQFWTYLKGSEYRLGLLVNFSPAELEIKRAVYDTARDDFSRESASSPRDSATSIEVFTTRPDTIFGATYMVLAPEHALVQKWLEEGVIKNREEVANYIQAAKKKSEIERTNTEKEKSGVELKGIKAINPAIAKWQSQNNADTASLSQKNADSATHSLTNAEQTRNGAEEVQRESASSLRESATSQEVEIPVFIADYVLAHYGTGAIMAVPAHDERDYAFASQKNAEQTRNNADCASRSLTDAEQMRTDTEKIRIRKVVDCGELPCAESGKLINSGPFDGLDNEEAKQKIVDWLAGKDKMPVFQHDPMKEGVPTEERDNVSVILYDPETDKYAFLKWADEIGWKTPIGGGVKDGETLIEAAQREIEEESGYTNITFVSFTTDYTTKGYAKHKNINRVAHWYGLYFELKSKEQDEISESEKQKHELVWLAENEVQDFLNTEGSKYHWEQFLKLKKKGELNKKYHPYARMTKTYRLRDWVVSRQRYWGVPIPVVHCDSCGAVPEKEENLPVLLPEVEDFLPSDDGRSPLAKVEAFVNTTCPVCGAPAKRETDTLDTFVDSSWYFLRYIDPHNKETFSSKEAQECWMPVDFYSGGAEHTTMHVLYSRFWHKALFDLGLVKDSEPYKRRLNRGIILGPDGNKMSKSKGNVIDPDEVVEQVGSDTVRGYLAFIGPYNEPGHYPWNPDGVVSIRRFLERFYGLQFSLLDNQADSQNNADNASHSLTDADTASLSQKNADNASHSRNDAEETRNGAEGGRRESASSLRESATSQEVEKLLHKTIKKVREDAAKLKFNTAISAMMVFVREAEKKGITRSQLETFTKLIAPFAPHVAEELWQEVLGHHESVHLQYYPDFDPDKVKEEVVNVAVQVNGKVRGEVAIAPDAPEEEAKERALADDNVQKHIAGKEIKKFIYVPGRIINIVV